MMLEWFNSREASRVGEALADEYAPRKGAAVGNGNGSAPEKSANPLEALLRRAEAEVRTLRLNFYKKAKFANSFKWRLIENGVARKAADDITQSLVLHLSRSQGEAPTLDTAAAQEIRPSPGDAKDAFRKGNKCFSEGGYAEAAGLYERAIELNPAHVESVNNLGASLFQLGRYSDAEHYFLQAIAVKPDYPDPYCNLGTLQRAMSRLAESEASLRRSLKLKPNHVDARIGLGLTLAMRGRLREARACFAKVLKSAPRNVDAMHGVGQIAALEGRFDEAEEMFRRVLELKPDKSDSWAAIAGLRRMTAEDDGWFQTANKLADGASSPVKEADLRFALGKYCDDIGDFEQAFRHYHRGNELLKGAAEDYDREKRTHLIDDLIRIYSREATSKLLDMGSDSAKPVFVVGMPRSGTSLAEQIIASHPTAYGAGELPFWEAVAEHRQDAQQGILSRATREGLAKEYLLVLDGRSADALRVVDKAPNNSDYLGVIYSVFPNARVIYMQRDPIDTCLSCYFQQFLMGLNFTLDLSDLAHYYKGHQRLMAHWRAVLPPGFILDVPYEGLVADQETWSRKMLDFVGLDWDDRCLSFHQNKRQVVTASAWQVRQKIYKTSVARWRNYEKFIGPLKSIKKNI